MEDKRKDRAQVDKIKEQMTSGVNKAPKVKHREYRPATCSKCLKVSFKGDKTVGYCCSNCGKYNSTDEAIERYESGIGEMEESKACKNPSVQCNFQSMDAQKVEYRKLRDESEIRADMFINGQTRQNMGVQKFDKALKEKLVKDNCYRGADKIGI